MAGLLSSRCSRYPTPAPRCGRCFQTSKKPVQHCLGSNSMVHRSTVRSVAKPRSNWVRLDRFSPFPGHTLWMIEVTRQQSRAWERIAGATRGPRRASRTVCSTSTRRTRGWKLRSLIPSPVHWPSSVARALSAILLADWRPPLPTT